MGQRSHLHPLGARPRLRIRPADSSLLPSPRRIVSDRPAEPALAATAWNTMASFRNGIATDWLLFGLLLSGYGKRHHAGVIGDPARRTADPDPAVDRTAVLCMAIAWPVDGRGWPDARGLPKPGTDKTVRTRHHV